MTKKLTPKPRPGFEAAVVLETVEESALDGATCDNPSQEAWEAAQRAAGTSGGIDFTKLAKCGAPAIGSMTTRFKKGPNFTMNFCAEHRPKLSPP